MARSVTQTRQPEKPAQLAALSPAAQRTLRRPRRVTERFKKGARYVFMRPMRFDNKPRLPGDQVPDGLGQLKMWNLFNSGSIRRADLVAVT